MAAFSELQAAIWRALAGDPAVSAIVGARVFDDVPHEAENISTAFPRVTIGDQSALFQGTDDRDMVEVEFTVHAWSRAPGRRECLDLVSAIVQALHRRSHPTTLGTSCFMNYAAHEVTKETDGETYHGQVRFAGMFYF